MTASEEYDAAQERLFRLRGEALMAMRALGVALTEAGDPSDIVHLGEAMRHVEYMMCVPGPHRLHA